MKRITCLLLLVASLVCSFNLFSEESPAHTSDTSLDSEILSAESTELDKTIVGLCRKMEDAIVKYKLYKAKDVPALPYQIQFESKDGYIMLTRYSLIKDETKTDIAGRRDKIIKIYTDGKTISKIESVVAEKDTTKNSDNKITIVDPSPLLEGSSDMVFTHIFNGRALVAGKALKDIRNSTAYPIANSLKRDFYIPHLEYFYSNLVTIGESYLKGTKDSEVIMQDILKKSTSYY